MDTASLACGHGAIGLRSMFASLWSETAINQALAAIYERFGNSEDTDRLIAAAYDLAQERRVELAVQPPNRRAKPAKWGTVLPATPKKTLLERRAAADERRRQADKLIGDLPPQVRELIPGQFSVRAVLWAICFISARDRGRCDASIATIAEISACSRSAVNQALAVLRIGGIIQVVSGKAAGTVSVIKAVLPSLGKIIDKCRQRMQRRSAQRNEDQPSSLGGGVQKLDQKTNSLFIKDHKGGQPARTEPENRSEVASFPASGTIYFSRWRDLVKTYAKGVTPDCDRVADRFRSWCASVNIALDAPGIEGRFIKFVERHKL